MKSVAKLWNDFRELLNSLLLLIRRKDDDMNNPYLII